jgi:hypothetical protein
MLSSVMHVLLFSILQGTSNTMMLCRDANILFTIFQVKMKALQNVGKN